MSTSRGKPDDQAAGTSSGARRSVIYELFVLGELMDRPHHGYLLQRILSRLLGPFRQVSWGALYPLIHHLEQEGLIALSAVYQVASGQAKGKQRNVYQITPAGQERFYALMREPAAYHTDYPDLFTIKLNYIGHLSSEQQLAVMRHYRGYLQAESDYLQAGLQRVATRTTTIPEHEQVYVVRALSHRLSGVQGRLAWLDGEIASIADEAGNQPD